MSNIELVPKDDNIPTTQYVGVVRIGNKDIPCAVLYPESKKPIRVFIQREIVGLLTGNKKGGLERYLKPKNLQPFVPDKFKDGLQKSTLIFKPKNSPNLAQGFIGSDIIDICKMYFDARKSGALLASQNHLADVSEIIVFAFAKTGVDSVIDEATGFQDVRVKDALEQILNEYLLKEAKPYIGMFPMEFYKQIYRLKGWMWTPENTQKRPGVIGTYTNDIIYSRLAPGLLTRLKEVNPPLESGYRKYKFFSFLSDKKGDPALMSHFDGILALQRASPNWNSFMTLVNRAYPKHGDTIKLDFPEEE